MARGLKVAVGTAGDKHNIEFAMSRLKMDPLDPLKVQEQSDWFSAGLLPTYILIKDIGLLNSVWVMVVWGLVSPFNLILLDEVEKAAPEVFDVLLGLFDEGRLTDRAGRLTIFRSCLVVMTSNLGARHLEVRDHAARRDVAHQVARLPVRGEVRHRHRHPPRRHRPRRPPASSRPTSSRRSRRCANGVAWAGGSFAGGAR